MISPAEHDLWSKSLHMMKGDFVSLNTGQHNGTFFETRSTSFLTSDKQRYYVSICDMVQAELTEQSLVIVRNDHLLYDQRRKFGKAVENQYQELVDSGYSAAVTKSIVQALFSVSPLGLESHTTNFAPDGLTAAQLLHVYTAACLFIKPI